MSLIPLNILLADDDLDDCLFFKNALTGFSSATNLATVQDGEELMRLLDSESYPLPDMLFLDLNMPRKNGRECLSEIKKSEKLKKIIVIIFSTSYVKEMVDLLYKNGADYFIRKPVEFSQFKNIIQQTLTRIQRKDAPERTRESFIIMNK